MVSNECFHFTNLKNLYGIKNTGLQPKLDKNSKSVGDAKPKISFSIGKLGAVGLFIDFNNVYNDYKSGNRVPNPEKPGEMEMYEEIMKSESLEDFLGNGVYLLFDGSGIENEGGNTGKGGIYDASTRIPIESNKLRVGLVRDNDTKKVSYSMYDYIHYLMTTLSKEEFSQMTSRMQKGMSLYYKEHSQEIDKFRNGNYSIKDIDIDTFCKACKNDIDKALQDIDLNQSKTTEDIEER